VPVLEAVAFGVFAQVQRGLSTGMLSVRGTWGKCVWLRGVQSENADVRRQLEAVQVQYQERRAEADRAQSLEELLALRDRSNLETLAAEIIAASAPPDFRTLTIEQGTAQRIKRKKDVIAPPRGVGRSLVATHRP